MRVLTPLFLAIVLAVASVATAMARTQDAGLTDLVICGRGGVETVTLDADGTPVDRPHHCPDCLAAVPLPLEAGTATPPQMQPFARVVPQPGPAGPVPPLAFLPPARGPPGLM